MKRSPLKKKSKQTISRIQRNLWILCKQIIRKKYGNVCYTCGAQGLSASNWHTGHLWAKASLGAYLKYDLRVLRPQCYHCNINLGGQGAIFFQKMCQENGEEYMKKLYAERQVTVKASEHYTKTILEYQNILKKIV